MNIEIKERKVITIDFAYTSVDELKEIEDCYFKVLSELFLDKAATILTIAPERNYSLGYDFEPFREIRIGKGRFLSNQVTNCPSSLLLEISQSEEFSRGILIIIGDPSVNEVNIAKYVQYKIGFENQDAEVVYCGNDGKTFYINNPGIEKDNIEKIIQERS